MVSFLVLGTHFHIHRVVKYIELLVISKASEQEQGETQMGGKSTRHHIVAAWRTSMSRKVPVLKFGVMCRGTTLFYFWWFFASSLWPLIAQRSLGWDHFHFLFLQLIGGDHPMVGGRFLTPVQTTVFMKTGR